MAAAAAAGTNRIDRGQEEAVAAEEGPKTPTCDNYTYSWYNVIPSFLFFLWFTGLWNLGTRWEEEGESE